MATVHSAPRAVRVPIALLLVTGLVYANGLVSPLQFDDHALFEDPALAGWAAWWATLTERVRPLLKASYVVSHQLGVAIRHSTLAHHLLGLAIHIVAVALAFTLAHRVFVTVVRNPCEQAVRRVATVCAGTLALHPLATEAVTYITGRSVSLATLFCVAALLCHDRGADRPARGWRWASLLAFAAAVLTRETMVVVPAIVLLWEWARHDRGCEPFSLAALRSAVRRSAGHSALAILALVCLAVHPRYAGLITLSLQLADGRMGAPSFLTALDYLGPRLVLLAPFSIDPDLSPERMSLHHRAVASLLMAATWLVAWRLRRERPWWLFALGWIAIHLAATCLFPLRHDAVSERHFYPVLWAVGLAVGAEITAREQRHETRYALLRASVFAAGLVLALATLVRNADYSTEVALWEGAASAAPRKARPLNNLGVALMAENRWDDAIAAFEKAIAVDPGYRIARSNRDRAIIRRETGDPDAEPEI